MNFINQFNSRNEDPGGDICFNDKMVKWRGIALWLIENTAINFEQIANFCGLHILEIEALANGEIDKHIKQVDPVAEGLIDKKTIEECNNDTTKSLSFSSYNNLLLKLALKQGKFKYTAITKKKNKPDAIAWLLDTYAYISDNQIIDLIGTTKTTINAIRSKTYKMMKSLKPKSPVALGLCTKEQLDIVEMNANILYQRMRIDQKDDNSESISESYDEKKN